MPGLDLGYEPDPDWRRLATALRREGQPDRVPLFELTVSFSAMEAILGRSRPAGREAEAVDEWARFRTDFYRRAGYDFVGTGTSFGFPRGERTSGGTGASLPTATAGVIHDRESFERYEWPEVGDEHLAAVEACAAVLPEGMKVRPRGPAGVMANLARLMGFEGLSYALADDPELVAMVAGEIGRRLVELFGRYAQHPDVDFVTVGDDMGFRTATMISPRALREYVFPWHRRIVETVHAGGKIAVLHSDGNLEEVMDEVIGCGWEARHSVEDAIMTAAEMKRRWGGRIAICGAFDVDRLTRANPRQVAEHTRRIFAECAPGGGWAFGSGNAITADVPVENYVTMLRAARRYGS